MAGIPWSDDSEEELLVIARNIRQGAIAAYVSERTRADALVLALERDDCKREPVVCHDDPGWAPCGHEVCVAVRAIRAARAEEAAGAATSTPGDEPCARCGATYDEHEIETMPPRRDGCVGFECSEDREAAGKPCPLRGEAKR